MAEVERARMEASAGFSHNREMHPAEPRHQLASASEPPFVRKSCISAKSRDSVSRTRKRTCTRKCGPRAKDGFALFFNAEQQAFVRVFFENEAKHCDEVLPPPGRVTLTHGKQVSKAFHRLLGKDFTSRRERLEPVANLDCKPRHIRRTDFHHVPFLILAEALLARVNVGREDEMEQPVKRHARGTTCCTGSCRASVRRNRPDAR
jgi:hypothetical protein